MLRKRSPKDTMKSMYLHCLSAGLSMHNMSPYLPSVDTQITMSKLKYAKDNASDILLYKHQRCYGPATMAVSTLRHSGNGHFTFWRDVVGKRALADLLRGRLLTTIVRDRTPWKEL